MAAVSRQAVKQACSWGLLRTLRQWLQASEADSNLWLPSCLHAICLQLQACCQTATPTAAGGAGRCVRGTGSKGQAGAGAHKSAVHCPGMLLSLCDQVVVLNQSPAGLRPVLQHPLQACQHLPSRRQSALLVISICACSNPQAKSTRVSTCAP